MATNVYGTTGELADSFSSIIDATTLTNLLRSLGVQSGYTVTSTDGDTNVSVTDANELLLIDNLLTTVNALTSSVASIGPNGDIQNGIGDLATFVNNTSGTPVLIHPTTNAFVELQSGAATVDGSAAPVLVVDASHNSSDVSITGSSVPNSYSWMIGGSGNTTMNGGSDSTSSTLMNAGSGATHMFGGAGSATMYGGGATTMISGDHAGQTMYEFNANSSDSMQAGTGGFDKMAVTSGKNTLDDRLGKGPDTATGQGADSLYGGTGQDTLYGSSNGTYIEIKAGDSSVVGAGNDTINAYGGGDDTITSVANGDKFDVVTFQGQTAGSLQALVDAQTGGDASVSSVKISFSNTDGTTQTATLNNVTHIHFGG